MLPAMDSDAERIIIQELMEGLASNFKWELDTKPIMERSAAPRIVELTNQAGTEVLLIGGSNCQRLYEAVADQGVAVESLNCPGWVLNPKAIDGTITHLGNVLPRLPASVPIVIWGLDNSCFRALSQEGDLTRIVKKDDNKFHVPGDIAVTPYVLLKPAIRELQRLLEAMKDREIWIMDVIPRFLLVFCCEDAGHCAKVRLPGAEGMAAGKKLLEDIAELNAEMAAHLTGPGVNFVSTGDLLTGVENSSMGTLMDSLYEVWNKDPVHGERQAYTRIGLALLKHITKKGRVGAYPAAKRTREHPDPDDEGRQRGRGGGGGDRAEYGRGSSPSTSSRSGRETSRTVVFSDTATPDRRRGSPPGRFSGRRRDSW